MNHQVPVETELSLAWLDVLFLMLFGVATMIPGRC